jgi:exodeoxyribonuclease VII large subunit
MQPPLSVSELNHQIKALLQTTLSSVYLVGEISNLTYHSSGHIYFSLKDEQSVISCVMFKGNAQYLKFRLEIGMKINVQASLTVFVPRGQYQLMCSKIEPSGVGELALAYEQLKKELEAKGYFEQAIKKSLPKFPKRIAIVTSNTGAAIEDMKKVAQNRWPLVKFILVKTLVQGKDAKEKIAQAITTADALACDIMIVGRGGGSIEDLWAFNERCVAQAIYEAKTPIISAVGHESDFVISDFVADVRAATPSNAIEIALPDVNEFLLYIDTLRDDFKHRFLNTLNQKEQMLHYLKSSFKQNSFENRFLFIQERIADLKQKLQHTFLQVIQKKAQEVTFLKDSFELNHPQKRVSKGYVQVIQNNQIVLLEDVKLEDTITLQSPNRLVDAKVTHIKHIEG